VNPVVSPPPYSWPELDGNIALSPAAGQSCRNSSATSSLTGSGIFSLAAIALLDDDDDASTSAADDSVRLWSPNPFKSDEDKLSMTYDNPFQFVSAAAGSVGRKNTTTASSEPPSEDDDQNYSSSPPPRLPPVSLQEKKDLLNEQIKRRQDDILSAKQRLAEGKGAVQTLKAALIAKILRRRGLARGFGADNEDQQQGTTSTSSLSSGKAQQQQLHVFRCKLLLSLPIRFTLSV
jgi:hypothetical protein